MSRVKSADDRLSRDYNFISQYHYQLQLAPANVVTDSERTNVSYNKCLAIRCQSLFEHRLQLSHVINNFIFLHHQPTPLTNLWQPILHSRAQLLRTFIPIIKYVKICVFFPNVKYIKICYNLLKILLSDVIVHLHGLLFSVQPVVLLSLPRTR